MSFFDSDPASPATSRPDRRQSARSRQVADHYNDLDPFYRRLWGEHIHHGFWDETDAGAEEAALNLVHRVARDARLTAGMRVCDVGCGYGAPAEVWANAYGAAVTGYTVSTSQHAVAEERARGRTDLRFRCRDFLRAAPTEGAFDAVVLVECLSHLDDPAAALRKAAALLRPGGRLVVCAWLRADDPSPWARRWLLDPICREGRLAGLHTADRLIGWAKDAGFRVERFEDVSRNVRPTWTVVLARLAHLLLTDASARRFLLDARQSERVFAWTVPRLWLAYRVEALRYGWLVGEKTG